MHKTPEAVVLGAKRGDDLLNNLAVGELNVGSRGIDDQFLREAARKLVLVLKQDFLVVLDVLEGLAFRSLAPLSHTRAAVCRPASGIRQVHRPFLGPGADAIELPPVSNRIE